MSTTFAYDESKIGAERTWQRSIPSPITIDQELRLDMTRWSAFIDAVGQLFFWGKIDTADIAKSTGYAESTVYSALIEYRQKRERAL